MRSGVTLINFIQYTGSRLKFSNFAVHQCGALQSINNGTFHFVGEVPEYLLHSVAVYTCDEGFEMVGEDYARVCLPGGEWSGSLPECVSRDCDGDDEDDIGKFAQCL